MKLDFGKGYEYVSGRILLKTRLVKMLYPKMIRGYKATPHKIVEYYGGYDCAYRWFPIGKDYPKGEWYESKHNLYGWEIDLKPGQKPLSAYYWHIGEPEPTFHEYKHVDGILKYAKTTYKELPF